MGKFNNYAPYHKVPTWCFCNVNQSLKKRGLLPVRLSEHFITNRGELGPVADNGSIASG